MSRYEGLDLPQLLQLMHPLVDPAVVPMLPATPGWWIVLAWIFAVALLTVLHFRRRHRRNRYRREALRELDAIDREQALSKEQSAQLIAAVLKRAALAAYPRDEVAALATQEWAAFLSRSTNDDRKVAAAAPMLAASAYSPDADGRALIAPARRWIRLHRA